MSIHAGLWQRSEQAPVFNVIPMKDNEDEQVNDTHINNCFNQTISNVYFCKRAATDILKTTSIPLKFTPSTTLSDETKNFHRDRYRDFFPRPKFSRPRPRLFFETKYFRDRYRDFFSRPNVFETDTETFFETKCFRDRY